MGKARAKAEETGPADVYQIKITLAEIDPPIWRRVLVHADISLHTLHGVIQAVMPWEDYHLYRFEHGDENYSMPHEEFVYEAKDSRRARLSRLVPRAGMRLLYEYDFGDSWLHEIEVEKPLPAVPDVRYPVCVAGERACPPEDCGGSPGYAHLLETLADPESEDYEDLMEWVGGAFDAEAFDLEAANRRLTRLRPGSRRSR